MKLKKAVAGLLTAALLTSTTVTGFAENTTVLNQMNIMGQVKEVMPVENNIDMVLKSHYGSFVGKVKEIADYEAVKGSKIILMENGNGEVANIILSKDTFIIGDGEIKIGTELIGFYDANAPMIMIYPAQYNVEVVAIKDEIQNIKVDFFNKDLVSADNWLKLNISEATEIVGEDGTAYKGALGEKNLVVVYGAISKSIPAQTTPSKVIVLKDKEAGVSADPSTMDILVNQKKIETLAAYQNNKETVMVPLRAIAEALGYEVTWNNVERSARLGKGIALTIGEDNYIYMKKAPIQLGTAPEIRDERTYVPLSFFKDVVGTNKATILDMKIIIEE